MGNPIKTFSLETTLDKGEAKENVSFLYADLGVGNWQLAISRVLYSWSKKPPSTVFDIATNLVEGYKLDKTNNLKKINPAIQSFVLLSSENRKVIHFPIVWFNVNNSDTFLTVTVKPSLEKTKLTPEDLEKSTCKVTILLQRVN